MKEETRENVNSSKKREVREGEKQRMKDKHDMDSASQEEVRLGWIRGWE